MTLFDPGPIPKAIDRRALVYTYTNLHTYADVCPYQMYRRYIVRDIPYVESPAMALGNKVHEAFELRIGGGKPLPVEFQQWEPFARPFDGLSAKCELKVAIDANGGPADYWGKNVFMRGKIDVVVLRDNTAYINDFKSGNSKYEDPFEIALGALLLQASHPNVTVLKGSYTWLKDNRLSQIYDLSDTDATWNKALGIVEQIEADRQADSFEKRKGPLCSYCDVRDCENNRKPA